MQQEDRDIISKAEELGRLIAGSPAGKAVVKARAELDADQRAAELMQDYQKQARKIAELEAQGKPVEPQDKRALAGLQQQVASHPSLKGWMKAQADFSQLMGKVNQAIAEPFQSPSSEHKNKPE